jgi:GNAT superfamily N-acetyltransferase
MLFSDGGNTDMKFEIKKLTAELLPDWLSFFDNTVNADGNEWSGCYCMAPHYNLDLQMETAWEYTADGAKRNRELAIDFIKKGKLQGYLAYSEGRPVGWCNANDRDAYDSIFFVIPKEASGAHKKVKSIACFHVDPNLRGQGIATKLLEAVCADAAANKYDYVEAYPFIEDANEAFTGPTQMYENNGFTLHDNENDTNEIAATYRKYFA